MIGKGICLICKKEFKWKRNNSSGPAKCCSNACRYKYKAWIKFRWKDLTEEQKLNKYKEGFERKVIKKDGCWGWKGSLDKNGYGRLAAHHKGLLAHRLSWIIHNGLIPKNKLICHKCDNPICTNPQHLYVGTVSDNAKDCVKRGRHKTNFVKFIGSENKASKLSESDVRYIKKHLRLGVNGACLARQFNVGRCTVNRVKLNKTWKHVS